MKTTIKSIITKDKCQATTKTGNKCTQTANTVVTHRELSSETRKKLCTMHAHDVLIRHCVELQNELKSLETPQGLITEEERDLLLMHTPFSIQKLHDKLKFHS